ncbi:DUF447 family protein [Methanobacterium sp. VT]|uniref:DUF447 family protein n=2 Tax=Methanobacterium spitsbergense TaxID=2874285 RepID=A0A8T5UN21_9EURY|nr:DUF447 family protein [Methanobacterium spitsbergense]
MKKGLLYETILTTRNDDGTPNAAPIGVICKDNKEVVLYLHQGSCTVHNIKKNQSFIVNILKDPMVFVESTMGDLSEKYFEQYENEFYIKNTDAFFLANVTSLKDVEREDNFGISVITVLRAETSYIIKKKECVEPLNRAIYGIIEGLVYLTRMEMVSGDMEKLYRHRMSEISRIVNKVGGEEHKNAMKKISEAFKKYD